MTMSTFSGFLLLVHIAAGFTALTVGMVPMLSKKGGRLHKSGGRVYFGAMAGVFLTAMPLSLLKSNFFLFSVGILSFYITLQGVRWVQRKNEARTWYDKLITGISFVTSLGMIGVAGYGLMVDQMEMGSVLMVFGLLLFIFSLKELRSIMGKRVSRYGKKAWLIEHISSMGGSYIAAFRAFAVTNIKFLPDTVNWLLPTVVGSVLITMTIRRYAVKVKSGVGL
jgi:uncharacterized membrane protein